ncbi:MAG: penicillin binding protein PBP4B [Bacillota bacterium]
MQKFFLLFIILTIISSLFTVCSAAQKDSDIPVLPVSQFDPVFPDRDPETRMLVNNKRWFKAYAGQGIIYIRNHGVTTANIYINDKKVSSGAAFSTANGVTAVNIGKYTCDNINYLRVEDIVPGRTTDDKNPASFELFMPYPVLSTGTPESAGMSSAKLAVIDKLINSEVAKNFPSAQLVVIKNGKIIKNSSYGYLQNWDKYREIPVSDRKKMTLDDIYDLASNSKMYATNYALMKLVSEGKISVDDKICKYLPEFAGGGRENIVLRNLLVHNAGFAPEIFFHKAKDEWFSQDAAKTKTLLMKAPLTYPTGSRSQYSDTDFMLLGLVIEAVTNMPLDKYVEENIYQPLGLTHTLYNPLRKGFTPEQCAATERNGNTRDGRVNFPNVRTYTLRGEVHDEKAFYSMDGIAGHAGLFSNSSDLAVLMQMMLNNGGYGNFKLCDLITENYFTQMATGIPYRGLGWLKPGWYSVDDMKYLFGPYASNQAFGHNGWTGTLTIIDPAHDLAIALLTNCINSPGLPNDPNGFVHKSPPFETGLLGSITALVYEAEIK